MAETTTAPAGTKPEATQREETDPKGPEALAFVQRCITDAKNDHARDERHRLDMRNLLFERGGADNQWIRWDASGRWTKVPDDEGGIPSWVPRACTNVYATKIRGVAALLDQSDPAQEWQPATSDPADLAAAQVVDDVLPVLLDEITYSSLRGGLNKLVTMTDKCALVLSFDTDPRHGMAPVPGMVCLDCGEPATDQDIDASGGVCPACGMREREEADPMTGAPMRAGGWEVDEQAFEAPRGKLCAELLTTFDFSLPSTAKTADERALPWVLTHATMDAQTACRRWPKEAAFIRSVAKGGGRKGDSIASEYASALRNLSASTNGRHGTDSQGDQVTVFRLFHDPVSDDEVNFPRGLQVVVIDDRIVEGGPLPVSDENGTPIKPVVIRVFAAQPGSPFGHPLADDLVPVQIKRNLLETLTLLIQMHYASPTEYIPSTVEMLDQATGIPGQRVRFTSYQPGDKPIVERGTNPPESLYRDLELCDEKMDEISGLNGVLQGERPEGNPTLGELQIRTERGMGSFKSALDALTDFEKRLSLLLLYYARETAWAPRFRRVRGDNGGWDVKQFTNADLRGNVDVTCSSASAWPKSALMQQLRIEKAFELGVLPPPAQDPELQTKILGEMDLLDLKPSLDVDRKQVLRILERWKNATTPQEIGQPDPAIHELPLHRHYLRSWLKTEEAEAIAADPQRAPVYAAMRAYIQQIDMLLTPPQPMSQTPGQPGASDGSAVDAAVSAGVLRPVGAVEAGDANAAGSPAPSPLDALVDSGTIRPAQQAPPQ